MQFACVYSLKSEESKGMCWYITHLKLVIWTHICWWHTLKERRDCLWHRFQYECVHFTLILRNMDNTLCFVFDTFWFKFQFTIEYMNNRQRVCVFFYLIVTRRRIFRQHDRYHHSGDECFFLDKEFFLLNVSCILMNMCIQYNV